MKVKFSTFKSLLKHSEKFVEETTAFIEEIESNLGSVLTETAVDDYDCDLKLLFIQTGGSEGLFLKNLDKLKPPFYLLTNGGNNSLAASLEILTYAKLNGYEGEILHGDAKYIAGRITALCLKDSVKNKLSNVSLGVFGEPSDWLISSIPSQQVLKEKLNVNLLYLPLKDVEDSICTEDTFNDSDKEFSKAEKVYSNLRKIVEERSLSGITIRCFDLLPSIKMTGCLALAKLNSEGIVATCEGDITAMLSMLIVKAAFGQSSFQANPSRIDVNSNEIVFAHCTVPFDMLESFSYDTHFESGIGIAIKGQMKTAPVTIFRLSSSLSDYCVIEGEITENLNESNLCRTQIKVRCKESVTSLLKNPCGNHHIIFYGHKKQELESLLQNILY